MLVRVRPGAPSAIAADIVHAGIRAAREAEPADLAARLGQAGELGHPKVKATVEGAIRRIRACGKPAGMTPDNAFAARCIELGTTFTGVDAAIVARATEALAKQFKG